MKQTVIKELNTFLEGNFMAIHAYENYIRHIDDIELKQILQNIQQNHKRHASLIAERIQNLNGVPVDGVGIKGKMVKWMNMLKGPTKDPIAILKDALVGEQRGIQMSQELVKGDLDEESLTLVQHILRRDQKHVEWLDDLIKQLAV